MSNKNALIVVGLGYGDEGKGTVVDYLTSKNNSPLVVRYNGGPQAAHNVYQDDRHFCFHQLGSGSFCGASTLLTGEMIVNPFLLLYEMEDFKREAGFYPDVYIDKSLRVNTFIHGYVNRIIESINNHGSCGLGVWHTTILNFKISELLNTEEHIRYEFKCLLDYFKIFLSETFKEKNEKLEGKYVDFLFNDDEIENELKSLLEVYKEFINHPHIHILDDVQSFWDKIEGTVIFEGAQGVGLDANRGAYPHVSATDTTSQPALRFLEKMNFKGNKEVIGVHRSYQTRHGNGPLTNEEKDIHLIGEDNSFNEYQKHFRVGRFDYESFKKMLAIDGNIDSLFITCLDNDPFSSFKHFDAYKHRAIEISLESGIPLYGISFGKKREYKMKCIEMDAVVEQSKGNYVKISYYKVFL